MTTHAAMPFMSDRPSDHGHAQGCCTQSAALEITVDSLRLLLMSLIVRHVVVGPFQENSYLLGCTETKQAWLIDPGEVAPVRALLHDSGLDVVAIVNTHGHLDHITGVAALQREFGVPFYLHAADIPMIEAAPLQAAMFGLPAPQVPQVDFELSDRQQLQCGKLAIEVRAAPGHSPGHVVFVLHDHELVFAGDCLFAGSIGRTDLPGGDHETLMRSLHHALLSLPDATRVLPGHGSETTIGIERRSNPFLLGHLR
jgi:glyoxylase-like metal-dependent hydrolase (beta-lactamase superfamily II)